MYDSSLPTQDVARWSNKQNNKQAQIQTDTKTPAHCMIRVIIVFNTYQLHLEGSNENNSDTSKQTKKGFKLQLT